MGAMKNALYDACHIIEDKTGMSADVVFALAGAESWKTINDLERRARQLINGLIAISADTGADYNELYDYFVDMVVFDDMEPADAIDSNELYLRYGL